VPGVVGRSIGIIRYAAHGRGRGDIWIATISMTIKVARAFVVTSSHYFDGRVLLASEYIFDATSGGKDFRSTVVVIDGR